jgi:hypothetical protein
MQQAAAWARIPTRLRRVEAARVIVEQAALQRNDLGSLAKVRAAKEAITRVQSLYDSASTKVADVVDQVRVLPPGSLPPVSLAPKAAEVAAVIVGVTKAVTAVEREVGAAAQRVLTPAQLEQLKQGGLTFPSYLGEQLKTLLKYALFAVPIYFLLRGKSGRRQTSW